MKRTIPDIRDYSQKHPSEWTEQDQVQSFEHAIALVDKYTRSAVMSTRGHVQPLGMIMIKKAYMLLLQCGWTAEQVAQYSMTVMDEFVRQHPQVEQQPQIIVEDK